MSLRSRLRSLWVAAVAWRPPVDRVDLVCLAGLLLLGHGVRGAFSLAWAEITVGALLTAIGLLGARR